MAKVVRSVLLIFLILLLGGGSVAGYWYWRMHQAASSGEEDDDQIPLRAWAELTAGQDSGESVYERAETLGTITDRSLSEISGIVSSGRSDEIFWVHNDSGDLPRIYALNARGGLLAAMRVVGAINYDWEDIASGPGENGEPALYIGDIGDNGLKRDMIVVYRVREPVISPHMTSSDTEPATPLQFVYPDGRHDAEALFVDPASGRIYIITKTRTERSAIYRSPLPLKLGSPMKLERVEGGARISEMRLVTSAALSPDASRLVIRTYFTGFEFLRPAGSDLESLFEAAPSPVALPLQPQGEAITYSRDGRSLVTISERLPAPLYRLQRRK